MSSPFVGEIRMFGGNFAPVGWAFCNGQVIPISENETLFQLIGTTYGGDGQSTFALPNLQSRIPLHVGPGFVLGQAAGVEAVTLTTNQIPSHTHPVGATVTATTGSPSNGLYGGGQSTGNFFRVGPPTAQANAGVGAQTGGNQPHDNMMPFLVVSFIISLFGIFPTQN